MKDFILSFILPSKMVRFRDLNIFIVILIFFACIFLSIGSSNLMAPSYIKNHALNFNIYPELADVQFADVPNQDDTNLTLPEVKIDKIENDNTTSYQANQDQNFENVTRSYILTNGKTLNLTVIYDLSYYYDENAENPAALNYDLEGYYRHNPSEDELSLLYILTKDNLLYVFNHGRNGAGTPFYESLGEGVSVYQEDSDGNVIYYLPEDVAQATATNQFGDADKASWTLVANDDTAAKDENGNYYNLVENVRYTAVPHFDLNKIMNLQGMNYGLFITSSTYKLDVLSGFDGPSKDFFKNWFDLSVDSYAQGCNEFGKAGNFYFAFIFIFVMPFLWILITWLMSRKYGVLTRFREYYAISAITFILPSFISFIIGFFIPYSQFVNIFMFVQLGFYLLVIYRINSVNRTQTTPTPTRPSNYRPNVPNHVDTKSINSDDIESSVVDTKDVDTSKMKEVKEVKNTKPSDDDDRIG